MVTSPTFKNDLLCFESLWHGYEQKPFRHHFGNQVITKIDCYGSFGIKGFRVHTEDGQKTEVGMQPGFKYTCLGTLELTGNEQTIRIRCNKFEIPAIELVVERNNTSKVQSYDFGKWAEFQLKPNERIAGMYGTVWTDDPSKNIANFGFIINTS